MVTDDWRLRGQDKYLQGATLVRKRYYAHSAQWEHDHCEFCWTKFMDPSFSGEHAQFIQDNPEVLVEGYAVQGGKTIHGIKDDYWWICPTCVSDFAVRFGWRIIEEPKGS